jgi:hypothetical protein
MVKLQCYYKGYKLGDEHEFERSEFGSGAELEALIRKNHDVVWIRQLRVYEHGGIALGFSGEPCMDDMWDSSFAGFAYIDKETIRENYGVKRVTKKQVDRAVAEVKGALDDYNDWLAGSCFHYSIDKVEDCDCCGSEVTEHIDSCGGFIGFDFKRNGMIDNMPQEYRALVEAL